ncbi:membrane protein insertase YidC [Noviherbaspirillum aridicola]|uniref:Membrane protein insertase YidC n=1 Tax=Noviherbaspirillum aridicola TaxID=2849687 RepID=A0ABQ4Q838_9BURK|nr:membrane protein insertase YidC [Noviherbaspirillum aridicola]GIZ53077.1 membrane protein insertase YidC [Noviherbaspirillum aridicola]
MDIQRTVLWVVFSLSLLLLWDNWMRYNGKQSLFFPSATQQQSAQPAAGGEPARRNDVPQVSAPAAATPAVPAGADRSGEVITITTDLVRAEIDTVGGELQRLELLKHKDTVDQNKNMVLFDSGNAHVYLAQTGLIGGPFPNHKTAFSVRPGPRSLDGNEELQLVLESEQGGVKLVKTYTFRRGEYTIGIRHEVINNGVQPISPSLYVQLVRDGNAPAGESAFYSTFTGPVVYTEADKFQKMSFEDIEEGKARHATKSDNGWVALVQHYFVSAFLPPQNTAREIYTKKIDNNLYAVGSILQVGTVEPGKSATVNVPLYSGPQESDRLEKLAPGLELVKDYGWLTVIAKPIFWLMEQIHKVLGNWGWTIIVLTVLIKLAFFPLSAASYRSMAKMKTVTPKMQAIRDRHKNDPQKMNQAMMELYKTEKINPLGGCLPILVQIPVFIALYWVLLASVEMRNAPWLGWITDLASPDPWFILPVIMAVSMFIQTKLNPTPPDPVQAKVMLFMPIAFSVMFFFFPAGLVLYWVVNNILSIAQQWFITRRIESGKPA